MNLIQVKQIDGLESSLNSLASSVYVLEEEVSGALGVYDDFWEQHQWTENYVLLNSTGGTVGGYDNTAFGITNGGLYVDGSGVFGGIQVLGEASFTSSVGQIVYKDVTGEDVELRGSIAPNYLKATETGIYLDADDYIVGVKTSTIAEPSIVVLPPVTYFPAGKEITVKDEDGTASSFGITISGFNVLQQIDGAAKQIITGDYGFASVYSDGSDWFLLANKGLV